MTLTPARSTLLPHSLFKPLQLLAGAFLIQFIAGAIAGGQPPSTEGPHQTGHLKPWVAQCAALPLAVLATYVPFVGINFQHHEWNHRHITARLDSIGSYLQLFFSRQVDGFYRPLTFLSLALDHRIFGPNGAGYHVQSIAIHGINAMLVLRVALALGLQYRAAFAGAMLFAVGPFAFDAVLWPAARFDLLATMFSLLALLTSIRGLKSGCLRPASLALAGLFYVAAVLNKESAYSVPVVLTFIAITSRTWDLASIRQRDRAAMLTVFWILTAILLMLRIALYGDLGGYPIGNSPHFSMGFKSIEFFFTRVLAVGLFTVNVSAGISPMLAASIFLYTGTLAGIVYGRMSANREAVGFIACALLSAVPAVNIAGWINETAHNSRYLYFPGIWLMLFFAVLITRTRHYRLLLGSLVLANALATYSNLAVYSEMFRRTRTLADSTASSCNQAGIKQVVFSGLPPEPNGVLFFRDELRQQIESRAPGVKVIFDQPPDPNHPTKCYRWNRDLRTALPEPSSTGSAGSAAKF